MSDPHSMVNSFHTDIYVREQEFLFAFYAFATH